MSDLVKRLREEAVFAEWGETSSLLQDAAIELARLHVELAQARTAALEEAARVCDKYADAAHGYEFHVSKRENSERIAKAIRALKRNDT